MRPATCLELSRTRHTSGSAVPCSNVMPFCVFPSFIVLVRCVPHHRGLVRKPYKAICTDQISEGWARPARINTAGGRRASNVPSGTGALRNALTTSPVHIFQRFLAAWVTPSRTASEAAPPRVVLLCRVSRLKVSASNDAGLSAVSCALLGGRLHCVDRFAGHHLNPWTG